MNKRIVIKIIIVGVLVLLGVRIISSWKQLTFTSIRSQQSATATKVSDKMSSYFTVNYAKNLTTRFKDVIGHMAAKESATDFISAIKNPDKFKMLGAKAPQAIILHGPPGNGKTLMARAIAGEAQVNFIETTGSNFVQKWVGLGAARVRELFALARKNKPCIIFIDEFEVLAPNREVMENTAGNSEYHGTVNQLLSELDGFDEQKNKDLFLITATNYLKNIDAAVIRSGRFDRKVHIAFPSFADRVKILELHLKKISADPHIDSHAISSKLGDNFSGADIATLVNEAALTALRRNDSRVRTIHFEEVLKRWSKER